MAQIDDLLKNIGDENESKIKVDEKPQKRQFHAFKERNSKFKQRSSYANSETSSNYKVKTKVEDI